VSAPAVFDFTGRHALVTGATSGIGLTLAHGFATAGATVTAVGLDAHRADEAPGVTFRDVDVTEPNAINRVLAEFDRLDVVVSCAGIIRRGAEHDPEVFAHVVDVNLTGTMRTLEACRPLLTASGGAAVATASLLSFVGGPLVPGYSASKGGIAQLVKSLAIAWAPRIRVNAIAPGWISTPLTDVLRSDADRSADILARTPMARWGEPADIVGPTLFLCSDAARFITGAILTIDGGYLAT